MLRAMTGCASTTDHRCSAGRALDRGPTIRDLVGVGQRVIAATSSCDARSAKASTGDARLR